MPDQAKNYKILPRGFITCIDNIYIIKIFITNMNILIFQVHQGKDVYFTLDCQDLKYANWMRNVTKSPSPVIQNLVACQVECKIYFYTCKPIDPDTELVVWYCKEFSDRLHDHALGSFAVNDNQVKMSEY